MLPFLKRQKEASVSGAPEVIVRESDHEEEHEHEHDEMLHLIAKEMITAIHKKDAAAIVECLRASFLLLDSEPHVEGEHLEE